MGLALDRSKYAGVPACLRERLFAFVDRAETKEVTLGDFTWEYLDYRPVAATGDESSEAGDSGLPVVFFSGGAKLPVYSFAVIEALGQQRRVIAISQPPCQTLDEHLRGVEAVLRHEGVSEFCAAGSSWGGCVAQAAAIRFPDRVERMILSSTGLAGGKAVSVMLGLHLASVRRAAPDKVVAGFRARALGLLAGGSESTALWQALFVDVFDRTFTHRDYISLIETQMDYVRRWAPLVASTPWAKPVLIVTAKDEAAGSGAWRAALQKAYPMAQYCLLEGGGHHPALERAEEYRRVIGEFLAGV